MKKKIAAIYRILNTTNGKGYVGSAIDLQNRWKHHKQDLRKKEHHSIYLQHSWNKYGEEFFKFEILEIIENPTKKLLEEREQYWMDYYKSYERDRGYNICEKAGTTLGVKQSEETKELLSKLAKERSDEHTADRIIDSEGFKERQEKFVWKTILKQYDNNLEELRSLLQNTSYIELSKKFNCSVDALYTLRKKLDIGQKRTDINEFLKTYSKDQLEDLYLNKYDRHLKIMADELDIYQDTLSKIFKQLSIEQKPHHISEYKKVRQVLSDKAKERAKIINPISNILKDPSWRVKSDATRVANGSMKRLKSKYRFLEEIDVKELYLRVQNSDMSKVAREFNVTRAVLDGHLKRNEAHINGQKIK